MLLPLCWALELLGETGGLELACRMAVEVAHGQLEV